MRANRGGALVRGALFALGVMGLEGGWARAQAVGDWGPAPSYAVPAGTSAPRPLPPGTLPSAVTTIPAAAGDRAALTSTAPGDIGEGEATGATTGTAPAAGRQSYFRSEQPPAPPSRLERLRRRVRGFVRRTNGDEGSEDHRYIDPSSGRTNLPISKPWLAPTR